MGWATRPSCRKPVLALRDAQEAVPHHRGYADALNPSAVADTGTGDFPDRVFVQGRFDHELCRDAGVHDGRGRSDPPRRRARRGGRARAHHLGNGRRRPATRRAGSRPSVAAYGDQTHPENRGKAAPVFIASVQPRPPELWKSRDPRQADRSPGSLRQRQPQPARPWPARAVITSRPRHGKPSDPVVRLSNARRCHCSREHWATPCLGI